jgi:hypothetical protein
MEIVRLLEGFFGEGFSDMVSWLLRGLLVRSKNEASSGQKWSPLILPTVSFQF